MIQLKNLSAGYLGKTIIEDISLEFIPGQVLVLLGPNGSGKSTLLKAALGLIPVSSGEILYDGINIHSKSKRLFYTGISNGITWTFSIFILSQILQ